MTTAARGPAGKGDRPFLQRRWGRLIWLVPALIVVAALVVLLAHWLRAQPAVADFLTTYPGHSELPDDAPVGFPAWLRWQHFLNAFFLVALVRTGLTLRARQRPRMFWQRDNTRFVRTRAAPRRMSIHLWLHLTVDALWIANGVVYVVLLFATGQWVRIVPTSWDIVPNAISAGLQYASLDWPTENGWANYNALQLLSYALTVFVAAPLAFVTGLRMSSAWSERWTRASRAFPEPLARAVHFPVMVYFVGFTIVHVTLVLATGALRNLGHMYWGTDEVSWAGFAVFAVSIAVLVATWTLVKPAVVKPIARLWGTVTER
ncbi:cytochrome b/b6 domain-containing protein [Galbitalea sp. SE-J8]|uniref:cytochrome b/b6 domain-containing protein n=1 Tax=Galbitalea sp. SE-J8 TaxID=3054952 RepID=UPI00259D1322|nr:cytochrome b/b6 domain-containing protein [Galbitalea sp. SE-J8]MDM4761465.1 cytochrome b/b6 domain-containing protein [Galbitalea sp. SE-J8]